MRRLALLGTVLGGLVIAAAACSESPVQPRPPLAASEVEATFATTSTTSSCDKLIYPYTLCEVKRRPALCAALNTTNVDGVATIYAIPYGSRTVDATFKRVATTTVQGSQETATTYYPASLGGGVQSVMTFAVVTQTQINGICAGYTW